MSHILFAGVFATMWIVAAPIFAQDETDVAPMPLTPLDAQPMADETTEMESWVDSAPSDEEYLTEDAGGWELDLIPYAWAIGIDADSTVRGLNSKVDMSFGDILDNLDMTFIGAVELRKDRVFALMNLSYLALEADAEVDRSITPLIQSKAPEGVIVSGSRLDLDAEIEMSSNNSELIGGYRIFKQRLEGNRDVFLDAYGGIRYYMSDTEIRVKGSASATVTDGAGTFASAGQKVNIKVDQDEEWVDPIVGLRAGYDFLDNLGVIFYGDVGGFDVGSDFAWSATALLNFDATENLSFMGGYRILDYDYETGSGGDKFAFDGTIEGPILGATYTMRF